VGWYALTNSCGGNVIIREASALPSVLALIERSSILAFDIESTGVNVRKDSLIGFGVCDVGTLEAAYIVTREWRNGTLIENLILRDYTPILEALKSKKLVTHNGSFDTRLTLNHTGVNLIDALHADTMLMAHTIDENKFNYGLKQLGAELFGRDVTAEQADMKESIKANGGSPTEFYKADSDKIAKYGLQDVKLTARLYRHYNSELEKQGLLKFFYEDEVMDTYKHVVIPMELHGVPVNVELLKKSLEEINLKIEEYEDKIQAAIKPLLTSYNRWYIDKNYPFKLSGPFKQKLAQKLAPEGWPRTETGGYSFNKADLNKAIKKGTLAADSQLEKYAISQVDRVPEALIQEIQLELLRDEGTKYIFNLSSKDCLKRLFFGTSTTPSPLKEKPVSTTDKGNPQVDSEFLDLMAEKYEWAAWLKIYNKLQKLRGTYIERVLEEQENGVFYPQFHMHRTVSGRLSGDFQQMPRPLEEGQDHADVIEFTNRIRRFFVAPEGYIFVDDDYNSLEPRTFAHISNDPALKEIFEKDLDFYSAICVRTERLSQYSPDKKAENYLGKVAKPRRQGAKPYSLGIYYGMTGYKLQFEINVPQHQAEALVDDYWKAFPELKKSFDEARKFALAHGYVKTEAGRMRRFPRLRELYAKYGSEILDSLELWKSYNEMPMLYKQAKEDAAYVKNCLNNAVNFKVQGLGASIINRASVKIAKELREKNLDARICSQVHDQLILICREDIKEDVGAIVQYHMENTYKISVPLIAEPSYGRDMQESKG
jgi:DNA polymerase I-like protein with 3'-5' exonuclease and polymerase domains